jgi:Putative auto-transporter adhesin, head GIN domain
MKKFLFLSLFLMNSAFIFGQNNQDKNVERTDLKDFTKVFIELPADVYIRQADSFRCRINGSERNLEDVKADVKDGELSIYRNEKHNWLDGFGRLIIVIEAPSFEKLDFSSVGKMVVENKLTGENLQIEINGPVEAILDSVDYQHVSIDMNGVGTISIGGKAVSTRYRLDRRPSFTNRNG